MKTILLGLAMLALAGCGSKQLVAYDVVDGNVVAVPITESEAREAIRDTLSRGISRAALSATGDEGYYANPALRIAYHPDMEKLDKTMRKLGHGGEIDRFVRQLNLTAEKAAARAKPVFIKEITRMQVDNPFDILKGGRDAATRYMIDRLDEKLHELYRPIIDNLLIETNTLRYYGEITSRYNDLPFTPDVDVDLAEYATERAIAGLYLLIAEEEVKIRAEPRARPTRILRRVYGALD